MENKEWTMPEWMKPYRELIRNTGGNTIEEIMNNHDADIFTNAPLAMICVAVKSQVDFLTLLYKNDKLKDAPVG